MTSKKNQCETCGKEKCNADARSHAHASMNDGDFCHGSCSPSQLDPLAELKKIVNDAASFGRQFNGGFYVDRDHALELLDRAFHLGEVSGATKAVRALVESRGIAKDGSDGKYYAERAVRQVVVELEGKGKV